MSDASCQVQIKNSSDGAATLTVGQSFELQCDGDWSQFKPEQAQFQLGKEDLYKIKFQSAQLSASSAQLRVTSLKVGEHKFGDLVLSSGSDSKTLHGVQFKVESVIDATEGKPEPFGPRDPLGLSLPLWYYGIWMALILAILFLLYRRVRRWQQRRKLIRDLEEQGAAMDPFSQFNQSLRRMQRQYGFLQERTEAPSESKAEFLTDLEKSYRLFIGRTFLIPTFAWKDAVILKELKRLARTVYQSEGDVVAQLLREFQQAKVQSEKVKNQDLQQLLELARKNAEAIFVLRKNTSEASRKLSGRGRR